MFSQADNKRDQLIIDCVEKLLRENNIENCENLIDDRELLEEIETTAKDLKLVFSNMEQLAPPDYLDRKILDFAESYSRERAKAGAEERGEEQKRGSIFQFIFARTTVALVSAFTFGIIVSISILSNKFFGSGTSNEKVSEVKSKSEDSSTHYGKVRPDVTGLNIITEQIKEKFVKKFQERKDSSDGIRPPTLSEKKVLKSKARGTSPSGELARAPSSSTGGGQSENSEGVSFRAAEKSRGSKRSRKRADTQKEVFRPNFASSLADTSSSEPPPPSSPPPTKKKSSDVVEYLKKARYYKKLYLKGKKQFAFKLAVRWYKRAIQACSTKEQREKISRELRDFVKAKAH